MQFVVFENLSSAYYTKLIVREMMLLLVNSVQEKTSQKVITDEISKAYARYLTFALVLQLCTRVTWKYTCSEAHNFFMYIKSIIHAICITILSPSVDKADGWAPTRYTDAALYFLDFFNRKRLSTQIIRIHS